jgi:pyruvate/2-oxoglutarate dehydrogenase complex dihydrolipoamide dehydrogenase (E3) component
MLGDDQGLLKLLFDPDTLKLLGVHISCGARRA